MRLRDIDGKLVGVLFVWLLFLALVVMMLWFAMSVGLAGELDEKPGPDAFRMLETSVDTRLGEFGDFGNLNNEPFDCQLEVVLKPAYVEEYDRMVVEWSSGGGRALEYTSPVPEYPHHRSYRNIRGNSSVMIYVFRFPEHQRLDNGKVNPLYEGDINDECELVHE